MKKILIYCRKYVNFLWGDIMKSTLEKSLNLIIFAVSIIASISLISMTYALSFIPGKYILILIGGLIVLLGIEALLIFYKKPKSKRSIITSVISVILSVCMFVATTYIYKIGQVVDLLAEETFQQRAISLVVLKDSSISNKNVLGGQKVGYISFIDEETMNYSINTIKSEVEDMRYFDYKDFTALTTALYNNEVDCVLIDEAFRSLIEEEKETFSDDTRVVYQVTKQEDSVKANSVDVTEKPFLVFISGNDEWGEISAVSRSDVNMLVGINPTTKQILLVSIPRDTYYPLNRNGQYDKFTHAGIYGLDESIKTLENIVDEEIHYYGKMNFTSFTNIIDALGGITIDSPHEFTTKIGNFKINKGINHLTGKQALWFVRERKSFVNGDFERGKNQQRMIQAVVEKVCSPAILTSFSSILEIVGQSIDTNMTQQEMNALVQLQLTEMPSWDFVTCQIEGQPAWRSVYSMGATEVSVTIPFNSSINEIRDYIDRFMSGEVLTIEEDI